MNYGMNGNFSTLIADLTEHKMRPWKASMLLLDIKTPEAYRHEYTEQPMKSRGERVLNSLRKPKLRLVRIPAGVLLILGGSSDFFR
jgi:hypothetical protein